MLTLPAWSSPSSEADSEEAAAEVAADELPLLLPAGFHERHESPPEAAAAATAELDEDGRLDAAAPMAWSSRSDRPSTLPEALLV